MDNDSKEEQVMLDAFVLFLFSRTDPPPRLPRLITHTSHQWVQETVGNETQCHNMFRMSSTQFYQLHEVLVNDYRLQSTHFVSSMESLAMFLWISGGVESNRQAQNRFGHFGSTISVKFHKVLRRVYNLGVRNIKPRDPTFSIPHQMVCTYPFYSHFIYCIGAIDGTHVKIEIDSQGALQYLNRHHYMSFNVLAVCDFDHRFIFTLGGRQGSMHDTMILRDALVDYRNSFPQPPPEKYYVVDSAYSNSAGYLAPYRNVKNHLQNFRDSGGPLGVKEVLNFRHSQLQNVIERTFGVWKQK